jgi:hypothetical protein
MTADAGHGSAPDRREPAPGRGERPSFLSLEKAMLGETDAAEAARIEARLASDPEWAAQWRAAARLRSPLAWERVRQRLRDPASRSPQPPGAWPRLAAYLDAVLPRFPRPVLAAAAACLALALLVLPFAGRIDRAPDGFRMKGSGRPEVALEVDGARIPPNRGTVAGPGAVLTFSYRSPKPLFAQIWYVEDGGTPRRFDGKGDDNLYWPARGGWTRAPQRVELEGSWKVQRVFIVASPSSLREADAQGFVSGRARAPKDVFVFAYTLEHP